MTILTLSTPIAGPDGELRELTFREPTVGDMAGLRFTVNDAGLTFYADDLVTLAARLAGVPPSALKRLPLRDLAGLAGQVGPLLSAGLGGGS